MSWVVYEQQPPFRPRYVATRYETSGRGLCIAERQAQQELGKLYERMALDGFIRCEDKADQEWKNGCRVVETWVRS